MNGRSRGYDGDRAEFDHIVARMQDQPGAASRSGAVVTARRPPLSNGAFAAISVAIIIPMSIVAGGWLGLIAVVVSTVVAGLLLIEQLEDGAGTARR
jgi:hypothetical protein